jgi:phosphoadenosine phosphosulfate reductase
MQQKKQKKGKFQASGPQKPEKSDEATKKSRTSDKKSFQITDKKASQASENKASRTSENKTSRTSENKVSRTLDRKDSQAWKYKTKNKPTGFKGKPSDGKHSFSKSAGSEKSPDLVASKKKNFQRFEYEDDKIFWCEKCNLPLIGEECGRCGSRGEVIQLSQPADVRFCSPYEQEVLDRHLYSAFGCNPLGERLILLNKIPGEDKTDEVLVDGFIFGILRFELSKMDYSLSLPSREQKFS